MRVPFLDLQRQYNGIRDEVESAVLDVMRSCAYIEGPAVRDFEAAVAEYLGVKHVITCGNGTDAIKIALKAANVGPGDEVITTPFSFFATAESISNTGATPVFVDIDEGTLNIDPNSIEAAISDKTKAILPVHIFGRPANMDAIKQIADTHGLKVIEDAAQAIGSVYKGKKAGSLGDLGCFSFYPTKNLGGFGDGGMITTDRDDLSNACRAFKAHAAGKIGYSTAVMLGNSVEEQNTLEQKATDLYDPYKYYNYLIADNSRLDSIQAAILCVKLKRLDEYNNARKTIAEKYSSALAGLPLRLPSADDDCYSSCWHQYAVLVEDKQGFVAHLEECGISTGAFYPVPLHLQKAFSDLGYVQGSLPIAERVCERSVCLPIFPELTDCEQAAVIEAIQGFCN